MSKGEDKIVSNCDTAFVQRTLRETYTVERFGSVKAAQYAAFDYLRSQVTGHQLTMRRVRAFFEGKAKIVRGEEKDAVRAARIEEAQHERRALRARLERLDALIAAVDAEMHSQKLAPLIGSIGRAGGDGTGERHALPQRSQSAGSGRGVD